MGAADVRWPEAGLTRGCFTSEKAQQGSRHSRFVSPDTGPPPDTHPRGERPSEEAKLGYTEKAGRPRILKLTCKLPSSKRRTSGQGSLIKKQFSEQRSFLNQLPHLSRTLIFFPLLAQFSPAELRGRCWAELG